MLSLHERLFDKTKNMTIIYLKNLSYISSMEVLDPTINAPLSLSKKKAIIDNTSAELKKSIDKSYQSKWSWLNKASVDDITQFIKDQ